MASWFTEHVALSDVTPGVFQLICCESQCRFLYVNRALLPHEVDYLIVTDGVQWDGVDASEGVDIENEGV